VRKSTWSNTLEAQRRQKQSAEVQRRAKIEAAQKLVDADEEALMSQQRNAVLERANRMLYHRSDRVKELRSGLLLANVLQERQAQMSVKRQTRLARKASDSAHEAHEAELRGAAEERERIEDDSRRLKAMRMSKQLQNQLADRADRRRAALVEEIKEGEHSKYLAELALKNSLIVERRRKALMRANNEAFKKFNDDQKLNKVKAIEAERVEDKKIAAYAAEKERVTAMRAAHEAKMHQEKHEKTEAMLKRQHDHLEKLRDTEARRTEMQVTEMLRTQDRKYEEMIAGRKKMTNDIRAHRARQLTKKAQLRDAEKADEERYRAAFMRRNVQIEEENRLLAEREFAKEKRQQAALLAQMAEKRESEAFLASEQRRLELAQQAALDADEAAFQNYAGEVLERFEAAGKPTVPIKQILNKPKDMAHLYPGEVY
jgi:hypothetical protein